jgi:hypothetical protein
MQNINFQYSIIFMPLRTYFQYDTIQIFVLAYNKINNIVSALSDGS